ncbi:MAG TPA: S-methyl-5-thioribose-1-phosphate isomerase [bacterium]|nr:S-methyl-5-thioribose-1-phosphate isomerase [bacterium]HOL46598.1 S-methyl-5-thioribose-1-phosphate isomerase [bacterium]HPQ17831.1 S-methyl-5-thioribose-1-phosphate isomerase [bacterium]
MEQRKIDIIKPIKWEDNKITIIDQTKLPNTLIFESYTDYKEFIEAIKQLKVRGAPALGIAGAYAFLLGVNNIKTNDINEFISEANKIANEIIKARPTAINLKWAVSRMLKIITKNKSIEKLKELLSKEALEIHNEDLMLCQKIGENGNALIKNGMKILTHCNAGALATGGYGTALAIIYKAFESGKNITVYIDETRPLLQGARLTAWELTKAGINTYLISDNMAGWIMKKRQIDCVIVGADRIAANGDTANKIGTYSLSILAKYHSIPFYIAAPYSTFDLSLANGEQIPIEERSKDEVINFNGNKIAPADVNVENPAFDITPAENINAIITEKKVFFNPFKFSDF